MVDSSTTRIDWRTSSWSGSSSCVEVACGPENMIRDDETQQ